MTLVKKKLTKNVDILEVKIHCKNVVTILTIWKLLSNGIEMVYIRNIYVVDKNKGVHLYGK